jgi:hypothetical protein
MWTKALRSKRLWLGIATILAALIGLTSQQAGALADILATIAALFA